MFPRISVVLIICLAFGIIGCSDIKPSSEEPVSALEHENRDNSIRYQYKSEWDNRFNETIFTDSAEVVYVNIEDSPLGFGFYVSNYEDAFIFNGYVYSEVVHSDKIIIKHDSDEIGRDANYFSNNTFFFSSPMEYSASIEFDAVIDTVIFGREFLLYKEEDFSRSDSTRIIEDHRYYYVDRDTNIVRQIKKLTIIDQDTLQVIIHYFTYSSLAIQEVEFSELSRTEFFGYAEINVDDLENEHHSKQISMGDTISRSTYQNIYNTKTTLYQDPLKKSVIMFSFIGCGGCEFALREMKNEEYDIVDGLNLYYSSPVDRASTLKAYLDKKKFPYEAFSKESKMNDDFSIYFFPTFVLIDSHGVVVNVAQGYGDDVREMLFED